MAADNPGDDLDLDDVQGLEAAQKEDARPLPKKVELDIDDMLLEEEEDEEDELPEELPPPTPVEAPSAPVPAPAPEEKPKSKISPVKLAVLGALVLIPIIVVVMLYVFVLRDDSGTPEGAAAEVNVELKPFVVNFPAEEGRDEVIIRVFLSATFPDEATKNEFDDQRVVVRDLIFRYIQGQEAAKVSNVDSAEELGRNLTSLVNEALKKGRIKSIRVTATDLV